MASQTPTIDFIFEPEAEIDRGSLLQGDLLERTPALAGMIKEAHEYYATAPSYSHFLVLTQSCDLVRRKGDCKSRYITICAVRPLSLAFERELKRYEIEVSGFPLKVGHLPDQILARQFLERVINNTVEGIFFIPKGAARGVTEHLCAFLPLSIALRSTHYDTCLSAKVAQSTSIFSAKIGSLTSGLYGRVATPDLSEKYGSKAAAAYRDAFFEELGVRNVAWLSPFQRVELEKAVAAREHDAELDKDTALDLLGGLPSEVQAIAERAAEVLFSKKMLGDDPNARRKAKNFLLNDGPLAKLVRGMQP